MKARVEQLALRFRLPTEAPRVHAHLPSIERALHARLADEMAAQLEAIDEGGDEVIVVREATAHVTLRVGDHARDAAAIERVSHAARETIVALLARAADDDEQVRRFPSDAAYLGAFVVALLDGTAWDRWYFDGFIRFRRADRRTTLAALLADAETECMALFAWLEEHGRLSDVLELVGPSAARSLASASPVAQRDSVPPADLAPLAVAAFAIAESLGTSPDAARRSALLAEFHRHDPSRPAWTDRRAITEWTWRFTRWIIAQTSSSALAATADGIPPAALVSLLAEHLDWLDGDTILARVASLSAQPSAPRELRARDDAERGIAPRHAAQLGIITDALRRGSLRLDTSAEPRDQLLLRMLAALHAADPAGLSRPDEALVAALEQVLDAVMRASAIASPVRMQPTDDARPSAAILASPIDGSALAFAPRTLGPEAVALVRALTARESPAGGVRANHAGIYLLTRPIADLRLDQLAARAGVPFSPLLAALAMKLLGTSAPFDHALLTWLGSSEIEIAELEEQPLAALERLMLQTLADQRHLPADTAAVAHFDWRGALFVAIAEQTGVCWPLVGRDSDAGGTELLSAWREALGCEPELVEVARTPSADLEALPAAPVLSPMIEVYVTSLATCVLRALSRWLPGLAGSSAPFLVRNCIARGGVVRVTEDDISVVLDRAPLDVVLEMAGCYSPMTSASWLGRGVRFSIAGADG